MSRLKNVSIMASLLFVVFGLTACGGGTGEPAAKDEKAASQELDDKLSASPEGESDPTATLLAVKNIGLPEQAPPTYWYAETAEKTAPAKSFGLYSKTANQRILFLIYPDQTPLENLEAFVGRPPHVTMKTPTGDNVVSRGETPLGTRTLKWVLAKFRKVDDKFRPPKIGETIEKVEPVKVFNVLVGSMPSRKKGRSILLVARGYGDDMKYSNDETLFILDSAIKGGKSKLADEQKSGTTSGDSQSDATSEPSKADSEDKTIEETQSASDDKPVEDKPVEEGAKTEDESKAVEPKPVDDAAE